MTMLENFHFATFQLKTLCDSIKYNSRWFQGRIRYISSQEVVPLWQLKEFIFIRRIVRSVPTVIKL